jgi:hypothetical protein
MLVRMRRALFLLPVLAFLALPASSWALSPPTPLYPSDGAEFQSVPGMGWSSVTGADHYLFQIAADAGFTSPVLFGGDSAILTRNTYATVSSALANHYYWWRVKSVTKAGATSVWSDPSSFRLNWVGQATPLSPDDGTTLSYPTPATVTWSQVSGAAKYEFVIASDPDLTSFDGQAVKPVVTDASSYTVIAGLTPSSTYYWAVTPIDGDGNRGTQSPISSFTWLWPSTTTLYYNDLYVDSPDLLVDPQFSWDAVPGAASYELEVNTSELFAPGSVVLDETTVSTSYSPTTVLQNNQYYWRVRAIDGAGHNGAWNYWNANAFFSKSFDAPLDMSPSISNVRMIDYRGDPGTDLGGDPTDGYQTDDPLVTWDAVPGASAYEVQVRLWDGIACTNADTTQYWDDTVATNSWTPLGPQPHNGSDPWANHGAGLSYESPQMVAGNDYCVRVRAYSSGSTGSSPLPGDWTYLDGGFQSLDPAGEISFGFNGYPDDPCVSSCSAQYPQASDYLLPMTGTTTPRTPYFTWNPIPGAKSYFVLVSTSPNFVPVVDYAFVRGPSYAPRFRTGANSAVTYPDQTTPYYWAVLPAPNTNGVDVLINPLSANEQTFEKQSQPPMLTAPTTGQNFLGTPMFQWQPVEGANSYTLEVATDPSFSNLLEGSANNPGITTDALSYTPTKTYPSAANIYWRVHANDFEGNGLTKSPVRSFTVGLPAPDVSGNTSSSEAVPTWHWAPVPGAVSYDFNVQAPPPHSTLSSWSGWRSTAATFTKLDGTGLWHWRVRASFATNTSTLVYGPWSAWVPFTNRMSPPTGSMVRSGAGGGVLLQWNPKMGAAKYLVEVSARQDFTGVRVERVKVTNPTYAPRLTALGYGSGGRFYWRVAAVDETGNVGETTSPHILDLPKALKITIHGVLTHGKKTVLSILVTTRDGNPVSGVVVRLSGLGVNKHVKTKSNGTAKVKIKPKKAGKLPIIGTHSGYWLVEYDATVR